MRTKPEDEAHALAALEARDGHRRRWSLCSLLVSKSGRVQTRVIERALYWDIDLEHGVVNVHRTIDEDRKEFVAASGAD